MLIGVDFSCGVDVQPCGAAAPRGRFRWKTTVATAAKSGGPVGKAALPPTISLVAVTGLLKY